MEQERIRTFQQLETFYRKKFKELLSPQWNQIKKEYAEAMKQIPYIQKGKIAILTDEFAYIITDEDDYKVDESSLDRFDDSFKMQEQINDKYAPILLFHEVMCPENVDENQFEVFYERDQDSKGQ